MPLKEFELLEFLLRNAGRVLTRGQLIDRIWGSDYFGDTKTLDVHIKRIRSKIEADPSNRRDARDRARPRLPLRGVASRAYLGSSELGVGGRLGVAVFVGFGVGVGVGSSPSYCG